MLSVDDVINKIKADKRECMHVFLSQLKSNQVKMWTLDNIKILLTNNSRLT